ncbi:MAG: AMP-binding protein, partial [Gammaproteobacteria bacterium]
MAGETLTDHNDRAAILARLTAPEGPFALRDGHDGHLPPLRVHARLPDNLGALLRQALTVADREFLIYEDERITYGAFVARVTALARFLAGPCGVAPGDRVALCMRNYPEWPIGFFACQAIGAVAVTLNAWWTGSE